MGDGTMMILLSLIFCGSLIALYLLAYPPQKERKDPSNRSFQEFTFQQDHPQEYLQVYERRAASRKQEKNLIECRDLSRRLHQGSPFQAKLTNVSPLGCQILSNTEIPMTTLLYLNLSPSSDHHRLAFVAYSNRIGEGFRSGLEFLPQA